MSMRSSLRCTYGIGALAALCGVAGTASAVPLFYNVVAAESNVAITASVNAVVDVNPDFTELLPGGNEFPVFGVMTGSSNTQPTGGSNLTADVGLPGNFNDGANGITFSDLTIHIGNAPGPIQGLGVLAVPLDVTGNSFQFVSFTATMSNFRIELNAPFSSSLTPTGNPSEWLWAGLADVTLSGTLEPRVFIPTQDPVTLGAFPFSQAVTIPLAGTFSGDGAGTEVNVGIPSGTLHDQNLSLPPIDQQLDLAGLGLVTGFFHLDTLVLSDISTSIVYRNAVLIPEPGTAALLLLGLTGLALRRRH